MCMVWGSSITEFIYEESELDIYTNCHLQKQVLCVVPLPSLELFSYTNGIIVPAVRHNFCTTYFYANKLLIFSMLLSFLESICDSERKKGRTIVIVVSVFSGFLILALMVCCVVWKQKASRRGKHVHPSGLNFLACTAVRSYFPFDRPQKQEGRHRPTFIRLGNHCHCHWQFLL